MSKKIVAGLSIALLLFHLYTAIFGIIPGIGQKAIHLGLVMMICFLTYLTQKDRPLGKKVFDVILTVMSVSSCVYIMIMKESIDYRSGVVYGVDILFAVFLIIALMEASRRLMGWALTISAIVFIAYSFLGPWLPGIFKHTGYGISKITNMAYLSTEGIWGSSLRASATYIVIFVIFGALLNVTGTGDFFTRVANSMFGHYRGGAAKVSVVSSALFGSISGSCMANVVGTGTFTIPLMKKTGFSPEFAGAVEASASTGGQIMPPVMASVAFLIAENLGITYSKVAFAALLPAILYFAAIFFQIDFHARKIGLKGEPKENLEDTKVLMKKDGYLFLPLIALIFFLSTGFTVVRSGLYTIIFSLIITSIKKETRMNKKRFIEWAVSSAKGTMVVAVACGLVGVMVGALTLTGLGFRLSNMLLEVSKGNIAVLLILTMLCSLIMGCGLPSLACYILLATLVAPALIRSGIQPIAAHLFLFYFGIIGNVTPPVAGAAYCAAGIAQSNAIKTGVQAFLLSISGFIIPFIFTYNPSLVMVGSITDTIWTFISAVFGIYILSASLENYFLWKLNVLERILFFIAAILTVIPGIFTDAIGFGIVLCVCVLRKLSASRIQIQA